MSLIQSNRDPSRFELKLFAVALPVALGVFGMWAAHGGGSWHWGLPLWILAGLAAVVGLVSGKGRLALYRWWTTLMAPVGKLLSFLLLATVYFGVVTPIGLLLRLVRGDVLGRRFDRDTDSYWGNCEIGFDPDRYFHQS